MGPQRRNKDLSVIEPSRIWSSRRNGGRSGDASKVLAGSVGFPDFGGVGISTKPPESLRILIRQMTTDLSSDWSLCRAMMRSPILGRRSAIVREAICFPQRARFPFPIRLSLKGQVSGQSHGPLWHPSGPVEVAWNHSGVGDTVGGCPILCSGVWIPGNQLKAFSV
jgi:hypothetical protein